MTVGAAACRREAGLVHGTADRIEALREPAEAIAQAPWRSWLGASHRSARLCGSQRLPSVSCPAPDPCWGGITRRDGIRAGAAFPNARDEGLGASMPHRLIPAAIGRTPPRIFRELSCGRWGPCEVAMGATPSDGVGIGGGVARLMVAGLRGELDGSVRGRRPVYPVIGTGASPRAGGFPHADSGGACLPESG